MGRRAFGGELPPNVGGNPSQTLTPPFVFSADLCADDSTLQLIVGW